jgi:subtilase family serine protease
MVSAICPDCNILLVEANSPTFSNLGAAELTAAAAGPVSIGNSYGGAESSSEASYDSYYGAGNEKTIAITAATGDDAYGAEYPAASPDVIAVGGTTLSPVSPPPQSGRAWTETAWSDAGSGCSSYEPQPTWQAGVVPSGCTKRAVADVSAVANPSTGVAVYDSHGLGGGTVFGGTSVATQIISATYARGTAPVSAGAGQLYAAASSSYAADFYDVTSGSNGSFGVTDLCTAGPGWDGPTGLGTPDGAAAF